MKRFSILAILVLCACMLFSCTAPKTPDETAGDDTRGEKFNASEYSVCISSDAGEKTRAAASELVARLNEVYGAQLKIEDDFILPGESVPTDTKEILIGSTNRAESQSLNDGLRQMDYRIKFDGTRIALSGPTDDATAEAVRYLSLLVEDDGLFIAKDFEYTYQYEYVADSKINGNDLGIYTIVYKNSKISKESAQQLAKNLSRDSGYTLSVVSESDAPSSNIILVGSETELDLDFIPDEYGYGIKVEGSDVYLAYTEPKMAARLAESVSQLFASDELDDGYENYESQDSYRIVMLGDSNTANSKTQLWLETILATRYPKKNFEIINAGVAGDSPASAAERLSWDVIAHTPDIVIINFGCNSVIDRIGSFDGVVNEKTRNDRVKWFLDVTENLIDKLKRMGITVVLATPVAYDEWMVSTKEVYKNAYIGFEMMRDGIIELAEKHSLRYVDYYSNLSVIIKDYREEGGSTEKSIFTDRIHMDDAGALAAAFSYLEDDWGFSSDLVADVSISADAKTASGVNADVQLIRASDDYVSYIYEPRAVPLPVNEYYQKIAKFNKLPLSDYNRELITVTGLSAGNYEIRYDGKLVKKVTADELAAGVNLAEELKNPTQSVAQNIFNEMKTKTDSSAILRTHVYIETNYILPKGLKNYTTEQRIAHYTERIEKGLTTGYLKSCMESYLKNIDRYDEIYETCDYSDFKAVSLTNDLKYSVEIVKVN